MDIPGVTPGLSRGKKEPRVAGSVEQTSSNRRIDIYRFAVLGPGHNRYGPPVARNECEAAAPRSASEAPVPDKHGPADCAAQTIHGRLSRQQRHRPPYPQYFRPSVRSLLRHLPQRLLQYRPPVQRNR